MKGGGYSLAGDMITRVIGAFLEVAGPSSRLVSLPVG
jgi:hypothetical protein